MHASPVEGRDDELTRIAAVLEFRDSARGFVITGDSGIGTSTLWTAAAARTASTHRVLASAPGGADQHLPYAGLSDLLARVDPGLLDALPPPQARALRVATLVVDPLSADQREADDAPAVDEQAVAYALLTLIRSLASAGPVLIAIDDLQWLDQPSAAALSYVVRRTAADPVRFLLVTTTLAHPVIGAFGRHALTTLSLGPIGLGPLHRVVRVRTGVDLARPELLLLHARSAGNPSQALDLVKQGGLTATRPGVRDERTAQLSLEAEVAAGGPASGAAHAQLAMMWISYHGDVARALGHARAAVALLDDGADATGCPIELLTALAVLENFAGPSTMDLLDRARRLAERRTVVSLYEHPIVWTAHRLTLEGRFDEARQQFAAALDLASPSGDEWSRAAILFHLTELECRAGIWSAAATHAQTCRELTEAAAHSQPGLARYAEALVEVRRGNTVRGRRLAEEGEQFARSSSDELYRILNIGAQAHAALAVGDVTDAARLLRPLPAELIALGWREPTVFPLWPDAIEALVAVGDVELATEYHGVFAANAIAYDRPAAQATAARCAGLLQATAGDLPAAMSTLAGAVALHQRSPDRYEWGRTLLTLGVTQRRAKLKRAARESLSAAAAIFDELGSPIWAERARAEIARIGGRVTATELTGTEERVAALAARGAMNREIAAELFVTEKTVEVHLSHIYRKVGVRSRVELAHRWVGKG